MSVNDKKRFGNVYNIKMQDNIFHDSSPQTIYPFSHTNVSR